MKRFRASLIVLAVVSAFIINLMSVIPVFAVSRTLYWVGGTATWDATAGTKWSLASGGVSGEAVPDSDDDVFIDSFSSANTITFTSAVSTCRNLDFTGGSGPFAGSATLLGGIIYGNLTLSATMTIVSTGNFGFKSTGAGNTITINGKRTGSWTFDGVGGEWTLQDAVTDMGNIVVTNGTFITNDKSMAVSVGINQAGGTLTLGTSTISGLSYLNITGGTLNASTSTLLLNVNSGAGFNYIKGGGKTYGTVTATNVISDFYLSGANTFTNLTLAGVNAFSDKCEIQADQVITGTLTMTGYNSSSKRMTIASNTVGTTRQLTAAAVAVTNCNIRDIAGVGAASWDVSAGNNSDYGANYGITFTVPQNNYWVGESGSYSDVLHWALATGGTGGTGRVPLVQDTAIFNADSFGVPLRTVTMDVTDVCSINASAADETPTFSGTTVNVLGNTFNLGTVTWTVTTTVFMPVYTQTVTTTSTLTGAVTVNASILSGTTSLASNVVATGAITLTCGIFDLNGFSLTGASFDSSTTTYARVFQMGEGTITLNSTAAVTKWNVNATNYTQFCETSTVVLTSTGVNAQTFAPGVAQTFRNVTITGTGAYTTTINAAATFYNLTITRDSVKTVKFPTSATTTITGDFIMTPSGVVILTLVGTTAPPTANVWTVSKATGFVNTDYLSLEDSTALGGATFYAGSHSTFVSHVTGWLNSGPTAPAVTTVAASSITGTSAVLNGNLTSLGGYSPVYVYFEWGYTTSYGYVTAEITKTAIGTYDTTITITPATTYHYRAAVRYGGTLHTYGLDATVSPSTSGGVFTPLPAIPNKNRDAFIPTGGTDTFLPADAAMAGTGVPGYVLVHLLATTGFAGNDAMAWAVFILILGTAIGMLAGIYLRRAIIVGVCFSMFLTIFLFIGVVPLGWAIVSWILTLEMGIAEARSG